MSGQFRSRSLIFIVIALILAGSFLVFPPKLLAYSQITEYLCEIGISFYQQGRYEEALHEFKKALIIQPDFAPALKYIQMIEKEEKIETLPESKEEEVRELVPATFTPSSSSGAIQEYLDLIEIQSEMINEQKQAGSVALSHTEVLPTQQQIISEPQGLPTFEERPAQPKIIALDESLNNLHQPIELQQGKSIIILGSNIQRFLVTQPEILSATLDNSGQLVITGKGIGYTYAHVWDDNGRWTMEFLGTLARAEGPTVAELQRLEEERANAFILRYVLDWDSYQEGRRLNTTKRQSYSWYHSLDLKGGTPYGSLDSRLVVRSLKTTTDLTYFTLGLSEGAWMNFKDFTLRGFDFYPGFSNLAYSGTGISSLRGFMFNSPAFNKNVNYTVFWGREGGGRYGNLSPGLQKIQDSFLDGLDLNFYPDKYSNIGFTLINGYGRARPNYLYNYAYDANVNWRMLGWDFAYEIANDTQTFAQLFAGKYAQPNLQFNYELRDINKNFLNIGGETWRRGERGGLFNLNLAPNPKLSITNRFNLFQDRLFPATDNANRWNEDYDFSARYSLDPTASLKFDYTLQNDLGKVSQLRYQSPGIGLSKTFLLIRKVSTYVNFRHQKNQNYSSPKLDYTNENFSAGIRFNLISKLYYFFNQQMNWLKEDYTKAQSRPQSYDMGLDFNSQIGKLPFYENVRFIFHDEKNASSSLSFLSGQDYIEGFNELTYRPTPEKELYCSARIRNIWAEEPTTSKRLEADFNAGMRYSWDTGFRWEAVGNIEGYVFRDLNSDGLRQRDEAPVEGVKVWLGKNKSAVTDLFGYYKFTKIKGRKAYVTIDASSLPPGYVLTVPQTQEAIIAQGRSAILDFGMVSRSEISGIIFFDANGDGEYNQGDTGIKDVELTLENGKGVKTDSEGRYYFRNVAIGEHSVTLNINSVPFNYLPAVPLVKKIDLSENITYSYDIPLKQVKQ